MRVWRTWLSLPRAVKFQLPEAVFFLVFVWLSLKALPYAKFIRLFNFEQCPIPEPMTPEKSPENTTESHVSTAIDIASRRIVPWAKCLPCALAASFMLARRGIPTTLFIGVFLEDNSLGSHAWLRSGLFFITGYKGSLNTETIVCYKRRK